MHFDTISTRQLLFDAEDLLKTEDAIREELFHLHVDAIPAGTVMTYVQSGQPYMMFQVLRDFSISSAKGKTLMYYEEGSLVFFKVGAFIPTLRFRDCRFPLEREFKYYEKSLTV